MLCSVQEGLTDCFDSISIYLVWFFLLISCLVSVLLCQVVTPFVPWQSFVYFCALSVYTHSP